MILVTAKADQISKTNEVYYDLENYVDVFRKEASVINKAKCELLLNKCIGDFSVADITVQSEFYGDKCYLYFSGYTMIIDIYDDMIINYELII